MIRVVLLLRTILATQGFKMNDPNKRPQALLEQCLLCPVLWWGHAEDGVCDPGLGWAGLG